MASLLSIARLAWGLSHIVWLAATWLPPKRMIPIHYWNSLVDTVVVQLNIQDVYTECTGNQTVCEISQSSSALNGIRQTVLHHFHLKALCIVGHGSLYYSTILTSVSRPNWYGVFAYKPLLKSAHMHVVRVKMQCSIIDWNRFTHPPTHPPRVPSPLHVVYSYYV